MDNFDDPQPDEGTTTAFTISQQPTPTQLTRSLDSAFSRWDFRPVTEEFHVYTSAEMFINRVGEASVSICFYSGIKMPGCFVAEGRELFLGAPIPEGVTSTGVITLTIGGVEGPAGLTRQQADEEHERVIVFTAKPITPDTASKPKIRVKSLCRHPLAYAAYKALRERIREDYEVVPIVRATAELAPSQPNVIPTTTHLPQSAKRERKKGGPSSNYSKADRRKIAEGWLKAKGDGGVTLADYASTWHIGGRTVLKYIQQLEVGDLDA